MKAKLFTAVIIALLLAVSAAAGFYVQTQLVANSGNSPQTPAKPAVAAPPVAEAAAPGLPAPDFALPDLAGRMRSLAEWRGDVVVLNFWATWCPPCREEIPAFVSLQRQYADDGLQFIGIALQQAHELSDFVAEYQINYPILVGEAAVIALAERLGNHIGGLPYTVVIDRAGVVQFVKAGPLTHAQAEAVITPLL